MFDNLSLEYTRVFVAVVDQGGFAAASRQLKRAQSVVTYAIQKLEEQLGVELFDRSTYRPSLTEAGQALLPRARRLVAEAAALRGQARGIAGGLEAEFTLVVDPIFPMDTLVELLRDFQRQYPTVQTRLYAESLGAATAMVLDGRADLGLLSRFASWPDTLVQDPLPPIDWVLVAAPCHPLARLLPGPIPHDAARDEIQLVISDRSDLTQGRDRGVLSTRTWRLSDIWAKLALLRGGLGWGGMPRHMVAGDLAAGTLVELPIPYWEDGGGQPKLHLVLAYRQDRALGPAGCWLRSRIRNCIEPPDG